MEIIGDSSFLTTITEMPSLVAKIFLVIFGLIMGSFASLLSHRFATKEPIFLTRSKCPKCRKILKIRSLIPLLSYLIQKGRCLSCKAKISWHYPLIEIVFAAGFLFSFVALDSKINCKTLIYLAIFSTLMVMIITDLKHYFIPDSTQYILAFLASLLILQNQNSIFFFEVILGGFLYLGLAIFLWLAFYFSAKIEAIGIDDLKLFFICGMMLGKEHFLVFLLLCGLIGSIYGSLWQKFKKDDTFPFAPAICCALYLCLIFSKHFNN